MKNNFLLLLIFFIASCVPSLDRINCPIAPSYEEQEFAQYAYNDFGTSLANVSAEEIKKMFGCFYEDGDKIYRYRRFVGSGYILVRDDVAITYYEKNN